MARRTLTIKRIDPWSVLKVGFLANIVLLGILLLAGRVTWFFIERLELIDRACEVASSVGFQDCGLNGGNIFRNALLLGLLGVVVQTGILVFGSFLHNLISELTGGLSFTVVDDGPDARAAATTPQRTGRPAAQTPRPGRAAPARGAAATSRVGEKASEVRAKTIAETPRPTAGSGGGQPAAPRPSQPSAPAQGTPPGAGAPGQPAAPRPSQPSAPAQGTPPAAAPGQPAEQPRPGGPTRPDASGSSQPRPGGAQDPTQAQRPVDRDLFGGGS